ncbi:DSD1 family PLP-dependent enzyme [Achromobacter piechaudii]|uniref:D-threo-3-hydroxyaspartate dehydratase n=2 Tax=Achromobacter piechaudii TaxID=72556 RepID=A0A6S7D9I5_9BURK|nr:DSD1 family PLP-dependent enzyme [Achromobacter piechaudii]EFF74532.1 alanine racemase domain protein [Achromobacter piechaudii ATCC 43553]CAB3881074.1 D-threo-3-hydroxyaspartate dehydratase [Achromobacter piechaudii]
MTAATLTPTLDDLETPCLLLDESRMMRNIQRLGALMAKHGVQLRPHLKTPKSVEVARRVMSSPQGPAAVSTLQEAEQFAAGGVTDLLYAVGVAPGKLARVEALRKRGVDLTVVVDSLEAARALAAHVQMAGAAIPALIEIDCDGHRAGVQPGNAEQLVAIARVLHEAHSLRGVMTHAGESYACRSVEAIADMAEQERAAAVSCAETIRGAGLPCSVVSVGSTPTAHFARSLEGVTEVRAGVYVFFDLVMAGLGVCTVDDIAASVLTTVIGHQPDKGWILVDAGWMAMSRDRGTAKQAVDQLYGVVCDVQGRIYPDLLLAETNQEQGIVKLRAASGASLPDLPLGTKLRILPNHACATCAQHDAYEVVQPGVPGVVAHWERFRGW